MSGEKYNNKNNEKQGEPDLQIPGFLSFFARSDSTYFGEPNAHWVYKPIPEAKKRFEIVNIANQQPAVAEDYFSPEILQKVGR